MKILIHIVILGFVISGCFNEQKTGTEKVTTDTAFTKKKIFKQLSDYPTIKDSVKFIKELRDVFNLEIENSQYQEENEKVTFFKKVKINGSKKEYFFVEYKWGKWFTGSMTAYPWKYQILMTAKGELIKKFFAERFEFVNIMQNQSPHLLVVIATARGNGGHEVYKFVNDSLKNVCESYYDYAVQTVDGSEDPWVYEPFELNLSIKDLNKDGFKDFLFSGKLVLTQGLTKEGNWYDCEIKNGDTIDYSLDNPFKKIPIEFVFVYDKKTEHFKAKENYKNKFADLGLY